MEDKSERFKRVASRRVEEILHKIQLLGNCSNKNTYSYSDEEVNKIFSALEKEIKITKARFESRRRKRGFKL